MCDEGKSYWGWVHVVSILIALTLHVMALYLVASLLNKTVSQPKPLTLVVRMQKASPAPDAPALKSGVEQVVTTSPSKPKSLHKALPSEPWKEIESSETPSPTLSMSSTPLAVLSTAAGAVTSESPPSFPGIPTGVAVGSDLAFFCPVRPAPVYPQVSRRMGEEGIVILDVEWDQEGRITSSRVQSSSGFRRLDQAALAAIESWRCNPAKQDGVPVSAIAVQPFSFQLHED